MPSIPAMPDVLTIALEAAVPLRIAELRALPPVERDRVRAIWAHNAADVIASNGDALQFGGTRGAAGNACNHLAKGLAALAFQPGGVDFAGSHFEATTEETGNGKS